MRVEGIRFLRGVAAVMVVSLHARLIVPGSEAWPAFGGSGVDIFFVISGYVMALTTQSPVTPARFALKRIERIVPLYWLATFWAARHQLADPGLWKDLLFIPRMRPGQNYYYPALGQGWTLNFEMAFYAIFAVGLAFGRWRYAVIGALLLAMLPLPGFYGDSIVIEFGFGILLYHARLPQWPRAIWLTLMTLGFVPLALGHRHDPRGLVDGMPALLTVASSLGACRGWLRSRTLVLLGDASYAIYLFHPTALSVMKPITRTLGPGFVAPLMVASIAVGVLGGIAVHLLVEKPIARLLRQRHLTLVPRVAS